MITNALRRIRGKSLEFLYPRDIDGLRALAVIPVSSFRAGLPGFDSEFMGSDISFVIGGDPITSII